MVRQYFASVGHVSSRPARLRRSCLVVPGSSARMLARAADRGADEIIFDLEDAVAPTEKARARDAVVEALVTQDYGDTVVAVRVNDVTSPHMFADIISLVRHAGGRFDTLVVPKVDDAGHLWFVEHLLGQVEAETGSTVRHGCEIQIESGAGAVGIVETARVTDRIESLVFGPGDYAASSGVPQLDVGAAEPGYPGHQWASICARIVDTARSVGADAIDGPYSDYRDADGFGAMASRARFLGMDGKWCIHPAQVELANSVFTPSPAQFEDACAQLAAYDDATAAGRGVAAVDGRMIDEASRKMAAKLVARGRAAGLGG